MTVTCYHLMRTCLLRCRHGLLVALLPDRNYETEVFCRLQFGRLLMDKYIEFDVDDKAEIAFRSSRSGSMSFVVAAPLCGEFASVPNQ